MIRLPISNNKLVIYKQNWTVISIYWATFFISVVKNTLHRHIPFYKIPANTCLVAQFLHGVWSSKRFVVQVPLLNHHKLYRQDLVFLHPMRASRLLNLLLAMNEGKENIVRKDVRHRNLNPHQVALLYHKGHLCLICLWIVFNATWKKEKLRQSDTTTMILRLLFLLSSVQCMWNQMLLNTLEG